MTDRVKGLEEKVARLEKALVWIRRVAYAEYLCDRKLRTEGARSLKRIVLRVDEEVGQDLR